VTRKEAKSKGILYFTQWQEGYANARWYLKLVSSEPAKRNLIIKFYREWIEQLKYFTKKNKNKERTNDVGLDRIPYLEGGLSAIKNFLKKNKYKNLENEKFL